MDPLILCYYIRQNGRRDNILDALISEFDENYPERFIDEVKGCFHNFEWPDICLSEKIVKGFLEPFPEEMQEINNEINDFNGLRPLQIEFLGTYKSKDLVTLYINSIEKTAGRYHAIIGSAQYQKRDIVSFLTDIIIVHEFVHWIVDILLKKRGRQGFKYTTQDEVFFHEGLAQYFTYHMIKYDKNIASVFSWLLPFQLKRYKVFQELITPGYNLNDVMVGIWLCVNSKKQSWTELKFYIDEASKIKGDSGHKISTILHR